MTMLVDMVQLSTAGGVLWACRPPSGRPAGLALATMPRTIATASLLARDCDRAIRFNTQALRFDLAGAIDLAPAERTGLIKAPEVHT